MQIKEIQNPEEISQTYALMAQNYSDLNKENYVSSVTSMIKNGYKMAAFFSKTSDECLGIVGLRTLEKISYNITIIEDFVLNNQKQDLETGKILLNWVELQAKKSGSNKISCSIETKKIELHKTLVGEKFLLEGFSFHKIC